MTRLAKNEICFGKLVPSEEVTAGIDRVTREDVQAMARHMFNPNLMTVTAIGPISEKDLTLNIIRG